MKARALLMLAAAAGAALLGILGTFVYGATLRIGPWESVPVGIVLALIAVSAYGIAVRAAAGISCLAAATLTLFVVTELMTRPGPGGDILVPDTPTSYVWLVGAGVLPLLAAFLPRRWFVQRGSA